MSESGRKRKERGLSGVVTSYRREHRKRVKKELDLLEKAAKIAQIVDNAGAGLERSETLMGVIDRMQAPGFSFASDDYFRDSVSDSFDSARAMDIVVRAGLSAINGEYFDDQLCELEDGRDYFMDCLFCAIKPNKTLATRLESYMKCEIAWLANQDRSENAVIKKLQIFEEEFNKLPLVKLLHSFGELE